MLVITQIINVFCMLVTVQQQMTVCCMLEILQQIMAFCCLLEIVQQIMYVCCMLVIVQQVMNACCMTVITVVVLGVSDRYSSIAFKLGLQVNILSLVVDSLYFDIHKFPRAMKASLAFCNLVLISLSAPPLLSIL